MTQIFDEKNTSAYAGNKIVLGIQEEEPVLVESDGGNVFAFVCDKGLYSYNVSEQKMAVLYTFQDDTFDERCMYDAHNMKILTVDETGNVRFVVYGYMNRGLHEGQVRSWYAIITACSTRLKRRSIYPMTKVMQFWKQR